MFDNYMIVESGFCNVDDGEGTGFQIKARLPYYRGIGLSMVEDVSVTVDGETFPRETVRVVLHDKQFTLEAMENEYRERWEFGEVGTVIIRKRGGLAPGRHKIELTSQLRVSYLPFPLIGTDRKELTLE